MLLRRGKTYYCRIWVPLDLRARLGYRKELKRSLQTDNKSSAKALEAALVFKSEIVFFRMRSGMLTERELEIIAGQLISEFTGAVTEFRGQRKSVIDIAEAGRIPQGIDINMGGLELLDSTLTYVKHPDSVKALSDSYKANVKGLDNELQTGLFSDRTRSLALKIVIERKLDIPLPSSEWFNPNEDEWDDAPPPDFGRLCERVVSALIDSYSVAEEIALAKRDTPLQRQIASRIEAAKPRLKLSDLWKEHRNEKLAKGRWNFGTTSKYTDYFGEALLILGDKELAEYTRADATLYLTELAKCGNMPSTRTSKIEFLSSMFRTAIIDPAACDRWQVRGNPFKDMQVADNISVKEKRIPYTNEDIYGLLTGLLKVRKVVEPHRFWVPLIALYSGMRQNEICQLRCEDIKFEENIPFIKICHNPSLKQTTKNKRDRTCPIHPMLLRLGLLSYVKSTSDTKSEMLFPKLTHTVGKNWSGMIRGWWNEQFQHKWIADTEHKAFHSFRGTLIDWFKQNAAYRNVNDRDVLKSIIGHDAEDDVMGKNYEQYFPVSTQFKLLKKLDYKIDPDLIKQLINKKY